MARSLIVALVLALALVPASAYQLGARAQLSARQAQPARQVLPAIFMQEEPAEPADAADAAEAAPPAAEPAAPKTVSRSRFFFFSSQHILRFSSSVLISSLAQVGPPAPDVNIIYALFAGAVVLGSFFTDDAGTATAHGFKWPVN